MMPRQIAVPGSTHCPAVVALIGALGPACFPVSYLAHLF